MNPTPPGGPAEASVDSGIERLDEATYRAEPERLKAFVSRLLEAVKVEPEQARLVADVLVQADLRGMHSHGLIRLPVYLRRLREGGFNAGARGRILRESAATALLDGEHGLGAVMTARAMGIAIAKAREGGIAACGVVNSNHNGEGAYYVLQAIRADMIGIATTTGSPIMPVWGGKTPLTGPLPISVGVPTGSELPIVLDAALGMSSRGKILDHLAKGKELPPGWLVDAAGRPTTDPSWVNKGGWILPIGGHKGWGLILVCEILAGLLTGGRIGRELINLYDDLDRPQGNGQLVIAIDIGAFIDLDAFKARVDGYIREMKGSELAPGFEEIFMPGEIEFRNEARQRAEGIRLGRKVVDEVLEVAAELGVVAFARP
jgi:LDH2 family malate/lactate/ureidoglycolate dehydrogenase